MTVTRCTPRPGERVEVRRQRRDERLALAGLHLGDPAEVQRGAAHELHVEVALAEHPAPGLAHGRERLGQQVVQHVGDELLAVLGVLALEPGPGRPAPGTRRSGRASCSSDRRSISGSSALISGTIASTALRRRPSPAWRIFWMKPMRSASLPAPRPGFMSCRRSGQVRPRASRAPRTSPPPCGSAAAASRGCCARGS